MSPLTASTTTRRWALTAGAAVGGLLAGVFLVPQASFAGLTPTSTTALASTQTPTKTVAMRNKAGTHIATATFTLRNGLVQVNLVAHPGYYQYPGYHAFHMHSNDNPTNGSGCNTDGVPFSAVDGHYVGTGTTHGNHMGDFPSLLSARDGSGTLTFNASSWLTWSELSGRAVILHLGKDNYNNIPTGAAPEQYTPNSSTATTNSAATGDAGGRVACGVIPAG